MDLMDSVTKDVFGPSAVRFTSKLLVYAPREKHGFKCHVLAGMGVSAETQTLPETGKTFEMWECEIIIIPRRKHLNPKNPLARYTVDQALTCGYEDEDNYKKHVNGGLRDEDNRRD